MKLSVLSLLIILSTKLIAQENQDFNSNKKYHPDSIIRWTKRILNATSKKHPGFYRYTTKENFNFTIDSTCQTITDSLTELDFYRKIKPLFAKIGCVHTKISLSKEYNNYLNKTSTLFPFEIFINDEKRVFITKNFSSNQSILITSEILSINSKSIGEILKILYKTIPSDGYNQTEKTLLLNHRFAFWYQTIVEVNEKFNVVIADEGTPKIYEVSGVSKDLFPTLKSIETNYKKPLEFELKDNVGIIKIHSFAKTDIKGNGQNLKKFTRKTFKALKDGTVSNLVIDLRYNTGGTDGNAALLASYFFDKPFRYWDKIEVTEDLAKEIKGLLRVIYAKPLKKDGTYLWRKSIFTREFNYYKIQRPARRNFIGKTYILTNGIVTINPVGIFEVGIMPLVFP